MEAQRDPATDKSEAERIALALEKLVRIHAATFEELRDIRRATVAIAEHLEG